MKLRNKKTGEVVDAVNMTVSTPCEPVLGYEASDQIGEYASLAELNEYWEDYKPAEPLIKDEKIRKVVRAWAEVEGETQVQVTHCRKHILSIWSATKENGNIDFDCDIEETFDEGFYSINQLCGEGEE